MSNNGVSKLVSDFLSGKELVTEGSSTLTAEEIVRADQSTDSEALDDYGTDAKASESTVDDLLPGGDDTPSDSENKANAKADSKAQTSDKEIITVTDAEGRKRKVEIDYSNREAVKKAHLLANGARKWQADRDKAIQEKQSVETELQQVKKDWSTLDEAFQKGPEHLFDLLQGRAGAFKEHIAKELQREKFLENASPEEIRAYKAEEAAQAERSRIAQVEKKNAELEKKLNDTLESASEKELASSIHPVFNKYRFADKLDNADDEHMFDSMLWNTALERLQPYEEKGLLTSELIEKEFKNVSTALRNRINVQADKKATKVVEQKKREATENVQAKVMSGYKTGGSAQEARDLMKKGDLTTLLKGWGKYGSLFNQGKK